MEGFKDLMFINVLQSINDTVLQLGYSLPRAIRQDAILNADGAGECTNMALNRQDSLYPNCTGIRSCIYSSVFSSVNHLIYHTKPYVSIEVLTFSNDYMYQVYIKIIINAVIFYNFFIIIIHLFIIIHIISYFSQYLLDSFKKI